MWEWIGISAVIILLFGFVFIIIKRKNNSKSVTLDEIIGERCKVVETVDNYVGCGLVKVKGHVWAARGVDDDDIFEIGESLMVVAIEGVKLICKKNK